MIATFVAESVVTRIVMINDYAHIYAKCVANRSATTGITASIAAGIVISSQNGIIPN